MTKHACGGKRKADLMYETMQNRVGGEILSSPAVAGKCVFTIDVEDWFHILQIPAAPRFETWDQLPSVVEASFMHLLDLCEQANVRATCFFLGWIARRYPHLVRAAQERGHEVASHGYAHRLAFEMTEYELREDAQLSRSIIEDISGRRVAGYRSAGFSATKSSPWFFRALSEAGYEYDSSVFPANRQHGGIAKACRAPHIVRTESGSIFEFPISVVNSLGRALCFFGGGYLRLFPYRAVRRMAQRVIREGRPVIFYIHPREIDPSHPRLPMPIHRRFKSYVNLHTTEPKIRQLTDQFSFITFEDYLSLCDVGTNKTVLRASANA